ncbi:MAG: hypothetical protein ACRDHZ_00770 [Ktedonobacteraceae bacterium]
MTTLSTLASLFNTVLLICMALGGFLAFRSGKRQAVVSIQRETIEALQARIDALDSKTSDLDKENSHLKYLLETIQAALSQKGIAVTISGDLVTIQDQEGRASSIRRRPPITIKSGKEKEA